MSPTSRRRAIRSGLPAAILTVAALTGVTPASAAPSTKITGLEKACTVVGTHGNDRLLGTHGYDVICGLGGDDIIDGGGGDDIIDAGDGNDTVDAGPGNDTVGGDVGDDKLNGGDGDDKLIGGSGADNVEGGTGVNTCPADSADISPVNSCSDLAAPVVDLPSARYVTATTLDNSTARTVKMQIRLTDDRAGVSSGLVTIAATGGPTVYLQSPRLVTGTANDGVWEFTGTVAAFAPAGQWHVTQVFITDRVNRNVSLSKPTGLPTLTVQCPVVA